MALQTKTLTTVGGKGHHNFKLTVTENSTSTANNSSTMAWSFVLFPEMKGYGWESNSGKVRYSVTFDGRTYSGVIKKYDGKSTVTIKSGVENVEHNADGSKTFSYSFSITDSTGWSFAPGSCDADDTMELTAIPRQATITAAPNFTDEQNPTITYSNPAGEAVTSVELCIALDETITNTLVYKPVSKAGTSFTYELSEENRAFLRNATPNSNSLDVCFCLRTVIGGVEYYSKVWKTVTIVNAEPVIDPYIVDVDVEVNEAAPGAFIRYLSDTKFLIRATAQKGAAITSQSVTCGGDTVEGAEGTILNIKSGDFTFTATDSRGNITTLPVQVPFVEYVKPTCSISNNKPDTDGNFTLQATGMCYTGEFPGLGPNEAYINVSYRYRESGGNYSDWMEMAVTLKDNAYTATVNIAGLDYRTTYFFQCKVEDILTAATADETPIKAMPVFDWSGENFNFNVPVSMPALSIDGQSCADFIVSQGISGDWYYQKFNSGFAKCWGISQVVIPELTEIGSVYASEPISIDYPFSFVEGKSLWRYVTPANKGILNGTIYGTKVDAMEFRLHCATNVQGQQVTVMLYAAGFWK